MCQTTIQELTIVYVSKTRSDPFFCYPHQAYSRNIVIYYSQSVTIRRIIA